ncbi:hypothetical protein T492DRAFT_842505 [Pavlovales sp. CCMP2436]|nr:hypothetical protein T492DRAFT_842505 [Pavlovales sp. CCMP2436]
MALRNGGTPTLEEQVHRHVRNNLPEITIGRCRECAAIVPEGGKNKHISRVHAVLRKDNIGEWTVARYHAGGTQAIFVRSGAAEVTMDGTHVKLVLKDCNR